MIRNTFFYLVGMLILAVLGWTATLDYYWVMTGQTTISNRVHAFVASHVNEPILFVFIGLIIGFLVGLVVGTIVGHLFWP